MAIENLTTLKADAEKLYSKIKPLIVELLEAQRKVASEDLTLPQLADDVIYALALEMIDSGRELNEFDSLFDDPDIELGLVSIIYGLAYDPDFPANFKQHVDEHLNYYWPLKEPFVAQTRVESIFGGVPDALKLIHDCPDEFRQPNRWSALAKRVSKMRLTKTEIAQLRFIDRLPEVSTQQLDFFATWMGTAGIAEDQKFAVGGWLLSQMLEDVPDFIKKEASGN